MAVARIGNGLYVRAGGKARPPRRAKCRQCGALTFQKLCGSCARPAATTLPRCSICNVTLGLSEREPGICVFCASGTAPACICNSTAFPEILCPVSLHAQRAAEVADERRRAQRSR